MSRGESLKKGDFKQNERGIKRECKNVRLTEEARSGCAGLLSTCLPVSISLHKPVGLVLTHLPTRTN